MAKAIPIREDVATPTQATPDTVVDTNQRFFRDDVHQNASRNFCGPWVNYAEISFKAAMGISSLAGLLRSDLTQRSFPDEKGHCVLSDHDVDNFLGLIQFAADRLCSEIDDLSDWANKRLERGRR